MSDILAKKYDITDAAEQSSAIDDMFDDLYRQLSDSGVSLAIGQLLIGSATGEATALALGTNGAFLRAGTSNPEWSTLILPNTSVIGDLLYSSAANILSRLADVATGNALISGGVGVAPAWGKIGLTTHVSGTLPQGNGGTGFSSYTEGDLLQANGSGNLAKFPIGSNGKVLRANGASADWSSFTIPFNFVQGAVVYCSSTDVLTGLAKDTNATRYLSNTGASNNPAWAQVALATGVSGTLPAANGGTGVSAFTDGSVVFIASGILAQDNTQLFWDNPNNRLGIGTASPSQRLDVNGNARVYDQTAVTGITTFVVRSGADQSTAPTAPFQIQRNDGVATFSIFNDGGSGAPRITSGTLPLQFDDPVKYLTRLIIGAYVDTGGGNSRYTPQDNRSAGQAAFAWDSVSAVPADAYTAQWLEAGAPVLTLDGSANLLLGTVTLPTAGTFGLIFGDGTALSGMGSNTAGFYANDLGGTVEMYAINEAGAVTRLSGTSGTYTPTNVVTDRSYDANATTVDELADVLGTLIADLQARGILA